MQTARCYIFVCSSPCKHNACVRKISAWILDCARCNSVLINISGAKLWFSSTRAIMFSRGGPGRAWTHLRLQPARARGQVRTFGVGKYHFAELLRRTILFFPLCSEGAPEAVTRSSISRDAHEKLDRTETTRYAAWSHGRSAWKYVIPPHSRC